MAILLVANRRFYCASPATEMHYRDLAKHDLLASHQPGTYTSSKVISKILRDLLAAYEVQIDALLAPLLSRTLIELVLLQYDQFAAVYGNFMNGQLDANDAAIFKQLLAPTYGRAVKFLCERIALLENLDSGNCSELLFNNNAEALFACATAIVQISASCDSSYYVAPQASRLEIFPDTDERIFNLSITEPTLLSCLTTFGERWRWEVNHGTKYVPGYADAGSALLKEHYADKHGNEFLDVPFNHDFGFSYQDALSTLGGVFDTYLLQPGAVPVWFAEKSAVLNNYSGLSPAQVSKIFEAFTVSAQNIASEGRSFWNPKFQHRLFRRGILKLKQNGQEYLCWGKSQYKEAYMALVKGFTHQYVPVEWQTTAIRNAVVELSRDLGSAFEQLTKTEFRRVGIPAVHSRKSIGQGTLKIEITPGEIDLLAYLPLDRILVIGECKRVEEGTDPKFMRDAKDEFVSGKKAHADKLRKKVKFVRVNLKAVCRALSSKQELDLPVEPKWISPILITRYPTVATCFIPDIPCVSLAELLRDYSESKCWPYPSMYVLCEQQVRYLAYSLWEEENWQHGNDKAHWFEAEDRLAKF